MCFNPILESKTIFFAKAKVAEKDIVVFKRLRKIDGKLRSPYMRRYNSSWEVGISHYANLKRRATGRINQGLHSYILPDGTSYRAIIPKGAYYYRNDREYVSSELFITSKTPYRKRKTNGEGKSKARLAKV